MRVLLVSSMFPPYCEGGVSSHLRDLASGLTAHGHAVTIFSCRRGMPVHEREDTFAPPKVTVIYAPDFARMFLRIGRLVRRGRFDVVHFHCFNSLALAAMVGGGGAASVFTIHSDTANYFASVGGWTSRFHPGFLALRAFERISAGLPDRTIAVSRRMKDYAEATGHRNVTVIPNAVDASYWSPGGDGGGPSMRSILVPRMHVPKNGIEYAIEAMKKIAERIPDTRLLLTGDGPLRPELERLAAGLGPDRVRFLGLVSREEMRELYREADVVTLPSITSAGTQETFGIAALEAMASEKPVIATDVGGLPELIRNGQDGIVIRERDSEALANAAIRLLTDKDLARALGREGRNRVLREFGVSQWAERVLDVYRDAVDHRAGLDVSRDA